MENMPPAAENEQSWRTCVHAPEHISVWPCRGANVSGLYLKKRASCAGFCETFFKCCAAL